MVILASASPRRQNLMHKITSDFSIITADIDEEKSYNLSPLEAVLDIAKRKGEKIKESHPHDLILSADTIVVLNNEIIHKPTDKEDAKRILRKLSNQKHQVITAYCLFLEDRFIERYVVSDVIFNELDNKLIDEYVATGSPMDKAGAYGVQDNERFPIIKEVIGSIDNVVGFPVKEIKEDFIKIKQKAA